VDHLASAGARLWGCPTPIALLGRSGNPRKEAPHIQRGLAYISCFRDDYLHGALPWSGVKFWRPHWSHAHHLDEIWDTVKPFFRKTGDFLFRFNHRKILIHAKHGLRLSERIFFRKPV
jgi:hypothetical protein